MNKKHKYKNVPHSYFPFAMGEVGEKLTALKDKLIRNNMVAKGEIK